MKTTYSLLLATSLLFTFTACDKTDVAKGTPSCIRQRINKVEEESPCKEGASVREYFFQGKTVYLFIPGSCIADASSEVLDEDCNTVGYLGGLWGNTQVNGLDFSTAEFKRTIWEQ
ncbi:DUF6970 domain-containing protein [Hymenobacter mucosus]|uniref:DUF6970 domain-containing protein n=1 Tax=Hymenobacter mucosus TaxID=1411120 RepID=A0A238ZJE3_9BACT|nr:hypothetical protein [Hymenobacter mucosus]SNR82833.1 hypothetical protein SAMN06269173_10852 [Hymenobacter mucosus]